MSIVHAVQYSAVQQKAVQHQTVQYSAVPDNTCVVQLSECQSMGSSELHNTQLP